MVPNYSHFKIIFLLPKLGCCQSKTPFSGFYFGSINKKKDDTNEKKMDLSTRLYFDSKGKKLADEINNGGTIQRHFLTAKIHNPEFLLL